MNIIYHADDYAANIEISQHILDCRTKGALNSLSVLPNSPWLLECMELMKETLSEADYPLISVHFNFAEGPSLSAKDEIPHLLNERGMFGISFFKLLILSFTPMRAVLKKELKAEIKKQLQVMKPYIKGLRIDSHQHYHMIPLVLETIIESAKEEKLDIEFIRVPAESLGPFIKHPSILFSCRPINLIKNLVLNVLNAADTRLLAPYRDRSAVFLGIMMSGSMDIQRVKALLPDYVKLSEKKHVPFELLCHPGGVEDAHTLMDPDNADCAWFYTAQGRGIEKNTLMNIAHSLHSVDSI